MKCRRTKDEKLKKTVKHRTSIYCPNESDFQVPGNYFQIQDLSCGENNAAMASEDIRYTLVEIHSEMSVSSVEIRRPSLVWIRK